MTRPSLMATVAASAATVVAVGLVTGPVAGRLAPGRTPSGAPVLAREVAVDGGAERSAEVTAVAVEFARALSDPRHADGVSRVADLRALATPELVTVLGVTPSGPPSAPSRPLAAPGRLRLIEVRTAVLPGAAVSGRAPTARVLLVGRLAEESAPESAGSLAGVGAVPVTWQLDLVATPAGWRVAGVRP
jgi:hypothetical protein